MGFLKSKSKSQSTSSSTSSSSNRSYDFLRDRIGGQTQIGNQANTALADLLGLNSGGNGFENYLDSTGYNFQLDEGSRAVTNNRAAKGLLNSGSTLKSLNNYGQNMGKQYFGNYLQQLLGLNAGGNQAASILAGAGGVSNASSTGQSTGSQTQGLGALLGSGLASIAGGR